MAFAALRAAEMLTVFPTIRRRPRFSATPLQ
jgi:hypothetical protein